MSPSKDFIWVIAGRLMVGLVGVASIRTSTWMLKPEEFGVLAMLITFQTFSSLFLINPVGQYINRHTHEWADNGSLLPRLRRFYLWVFPAAILGGIAGSCWALSQSHSWGAQALLGLMVILMVIAATANATTLYLLNMLGYRAQAASLAITTSVGAFCFSVLFTSIFSVGLAWFAGQTLGMALGALGAQTTLGKLVSVPSKRQWNLLEPKAFLEYILPLAIATGFMWWLLSGYRLMLEIHWGLAALGSAVVGLTLTSQLWTLLETLIMQFLYPMFFRRIAAINSPDSILAFSDLLNTLGPVYLVMSTATITAAPALLTIFVDSSYSNVVPFVILGAIIECCRALTNVLGVAAQVDRKMVTMITPYALGAATLTIGLFLVSSNGSILDAVLILIGSGFLTMVTMALVMRRIQYFHIDWIRWGLALTTVLFSIPVASNYSTEPISLTTSIKWIILAGLFATISIFGLLWKNPRCARLLSVQLGSKKINN